MSYPEYYNKGTIIKITYTVIDNNGKALLNVRYHDLLNNAPVDPSVTPLSKDFPQPFLSAEHLCCAAVPKCEIITCGISKGLDSNWVMQDVMLFGHDLHVTLDYLSINGTTVLSSQLFTMLAEEMETVTDENSLTVFTNLFDWLAALFAPFGLTLTLGSGTVAGELVEILYVTYDVCDIQAFGFGLSPSVSDEVGFDAYTVDENGYSTVSGSENPALIEYFKQSQACL